MSSSALFLSVGISSHTINHFKPIHIHVLGMYLMKGWSAAIVTEQVVSGELQNHKNQQGLLRGVEQSGPNYTKHQ